MRAAVPVSSAVVTLPHPGGYTRRGTIDGLEMALSPWLIARQDPAVARFDRCLRHHVLESVTPRAIRAGSAPL